MWVLLRPTRTNQWQCCETGPTVFCPYPRRLESLTICRCHYKGSTFFSVIWRPWVLGRQFEPATSRSADRRSPKWANQAAVKKIVMGKRNRCAVFNMDVIMIAFFPKNMQRSSLFARKARVNTERVPPGHPITLLKSNKFNMAAVSVKRSTKVKRHILGTSFCATFRCSVNVRIVADT